MMSYSSDLCAPMSEDSPQSSSQAQQAGGDFMSSRSEMMAKLTEQGDVLNSWQRLPAGVNDRLILRSPHGQPSEFYAWPFRRGQQETDCLPRTELLDTIRVVSCEPHLHEYFEYEGFNRLLETATKAAFDDFEAHYALVMAYDEGIRRYLQATQNKPPPFVASTPLVQHVMNMVYNRAIADPGRLNKYRGWTEEVYGEFSSNMVSEIVKGVPIKPHHKFIDLGSGVGQVVLQVAAEARCAASFGIEKQDTPASYAKTMEKYYHRFCSFFGFEHGPYEIIQGDFLEGDIEARINEADVIFVNNFAFGSTLNQQLKEKFQNAKEGAVIVSSLNFCPLSFSITDRNLTDISTIMSVEKVRCSGQGVSWTSRPFDYYIHIIDRRALESFFKQNQRGGPKHRKPLDISEASSKLKELPLLLQKASSSNSLSTARRTKKEGPSTGGNETVAESEAVEAPTLDLTPHSLAVAQSGARKLNSLLEDLYATAGPLTTALSSSCLHERQRKASFEEQLHQILQHNHQLERELGITTSSPPVPPTIDPDLPKKSSFRAKHRHSQDSQNGLTGKRARKMSSSASTSDSAVADVVQPLSRRPSLEPVPDPEIPPSMITNDLAQYTLVPHNIAQPSQPQPDPNSSEPEFSQPNSSLSELSQPDVAFPNLPRPDLPRPDGSDSAACAITEVSPSASDFAEQQSSTAESLQRAPSPLPARITEMDPATSGVELIVQNGPVHLSSLTNGHATPGSSTHHMDCSISGDSHRKEASKSLGRSLVPLYDGAAFPILLSLSLSTESARADFVTDFFVCPQ
eukprot:m.64141 g.64141  ORF g.64141 m.64141 type:complete len:799 (-) comp49703_c0_seq7:219-2615(-)